MKLSHSVLAMAMMFTGITHSCGQSDFFMSFNGLAQGAVNSSVTKTMNPGESGSLFIYYTTNGPANSNIDVGAYLDIFTSENGVIRFTSARTLDFDVRLFGSTVGKRWFDFVGETGTVTDEFINELGAFRLFSGFGILESNNGATGVLDLGYDAAADAFLFGRVDFTVNDNPGPGGTTVDVFMNAGAGGIVNQGVIVPATFGIATVEIATQLVLGDMNGDGFVNACDVRPFVLAIISSTWSEVADINADGIVNLRDIHPFIALLTF